MAEVEFQTISAEEINFGNNNFIEVARKKAISAEGENEFVAVSRGFFAPDGSKRFKKSFTIPADTGVAEFISTNIIKMSEGLAAPAPREPKAEEPAPAEEAPAETPAETPAEEPVAETPEEPAEKVAEVAEEEPAEPETEETPAEETVTETSEEPATEEAPAEEETSE